MRVAAIDCGSNSFHLLIADAFGHDQIVVIEDDKSLLYLGAEVASTNLISDASLERAKRVIRHYKTLIKRHNVDVVQCVATSAIRSATNGGQVIEALTKTLGHPVRVISGEEEAQTIFRAVSAVSSLPESRILACDMGGGSLEIMAGQRHGLEYAFSVSLGASRVAKLLNVSDPLSSEDIDAIQNECRRFFANFKKSYPADLFSHVVASSGTLTTLILLARARRDGHVSPTWSNVSCSAKELEQMCNELIVATPKERNKYLGYDKTRDEYLSTSAVIALEIASLVSKDAPWIISPYALREGLVLIQADNADDGLLTPGSIAQHSIEDLENRMGAFTPTKNYARSSADDSPLVKHGRKVSQIAEILFDGLESIHKLSAVDRKLIGYGARLHEIGETISHSKHDQHGAYILSNIPLVGFAPEEAAILRGMVRWHRTRDPRMNDKFVGRLDERAFYRAKWLTAMLRIADGADSGKSESIHSIDVSVKPDIIFIRFSSSHDCELEMYSARRKRNLLEEVSERDVVIEPLFLGSSQEQD